MALKPNELSKQQLDERLRYYEDLGIRLFYRDRKRARVVGASDESHQSEPVPVATIEEDRLAKLPTAKAPIALAARLEKPTPPVLESLVKPSGVSLFSQVEKVKNDSLLKIREDIGDCKRCKLHQGRNKIVFGDGSAKARLVFVGEGPGADEDMQGLPFVGRAGKLLTRMIEAMGLKRSDVYICNVVKCRPPENRKPEDDEVRECSPFLLRQLDALAPKVIVCLGAVAAQTLLETNRGISQFRGQWLDWRGHKLIATYHPAYLLRNPPAKSEVWKDLQKVMAELGLTPPRKQTPS